MEALTIKYWYCVKVERSESELQDERTSRRTKDILPEVVSTKSNMFPKLCKIVILYRKYYKLIIMWFFFILFSAITN